MIKVLSIAYGWLVFEITDGVHSMKFQDSYLDDFVEEIDYLLEFDFNDTEIDSKAIVLDGEGVNLYLVSFKDMLEDNFYITWKRNDEYPVTMSFNYEEFVKEWKKTKELIKDDYKKHFLMEDEDDYDE